MTRTIRTLALPEVETLLAWAADEGWNPGVGDAAPFHAADPGGFLGAFVNDEMVSGISAVAYDDSFGFIGLYICRPGRRGQGHGRAIWDAGMARLGNRTIGLDGVPAQQANYRAMGFVLAYETIRMTGALGGGSATPATLGAVAELDRQCFPAWRRAFLDGWLQPPRTALVSPGAHGAVRVCVVGRKIGPLFAETPDAAFALLAALSAGAPVAIDVPRTQTAFLAALEASGFTPGFETARMYRGPAPEIAMHKVFGTTSLELG